MWEAGVAEGGLTLLLAVFTKRFYSFTVNVILMSGLLLLPVLCGAVPGGAQKPHVGSLLPGSSGREAIIYSNTVTASCC